MNIKIEAIEITGLNSKNKPISFFCDLVEPAVFKKTAGKEIEIYGEKAEGIIKELVNRIYKK